MEIANRETIDQPPTRFCNCYKVPNLAETILGATLISKLSDQYVLGKQLGWGQFGVIRQCSNELTGEVLACKTVAKDRLVTADDLRGIKLEIEIMTKLLGHPNIVDLKAVYEEEDYVHLVMELCAGGELFHRLEKYGKFSETEARVIFKYLMQVVEYCHDNGIVHRDLKPENILLATTSPSSPIKLADFGLATYIKPGFILTGQSLHGTVGSPFYIAPEVLAGGYNQAADVWSSGVILYILLSGMPPFCGKTKSKIFEAVRAADLRFPSEPWDNISASAKDLIKRMLCVDPLKRLSAAEVLAHSWMDDLSPDKQDDLFRKQLEAGSDSFSTFITRNEDYSFNDGQLEQSPLFTCKSSFSSNIVENGTPCFAYGGFSFSSCSESIPGFSSPFPSLPSFTFFSPVSAVDHGNISLDFKVNMLKLEERSEESNLEKPIELHSSTLTITEHGGGGEIEQKTGFWRVGVGKVPGVLGKRNNTIGLGELGQLNLMVTESVIRWASCTHIPTTPSLRLSLVC